MRKDIETTEPIETSNIEHRTSNRPGRRSEIKEWIPDDERRTRS